MKSTFIGCLVLSTTHTTLGRESMYTKGESKC